MKRVLALYYSQSGDVARVAESFLLAWHNAADVEITVRRIEPVRPYPFPWGNLLRLLSVFPECHCGGGPGVKPIELPSDQHYDLVIFAYPIWFLSPALPVQDFLNSTDATVLRDRPVITICVSRNMWHSGSQTMKRRLRELGARLLDNIIVTHQGSALATFVSVPRLLLFGKRDRLFGIFPPAQIAESDLDRVKQLGTIVAAQLPEVTPERTAPLLAGRGAVRIKPLLIIPERLGFHMYGLVSRWVVAAQQLGPWARRVAMWMFLLELLFMVLFVVPLMMLGTILLYPLLAPWLRREAENLAEPSGM
ncbi:MAG: hypothetical protein JNM18_10860 [Planctomycetaceae bacterium]|nr:hypothetical protein [Planctomycetaceae bacterium]